MTLETTTIQQRSANGVAPQPRFRPKGVRRGFEDTQPGRPSLATQTEACWKRAEGTDPVAIDIEFQRYQGLDDGRRNRFRIGRICIVNYQGETILDTFANYPFEKGKIKFLYPGRYEHVTLDDLEWWNGARESFGVEADVQKIIAGHEVILHGGQNDRTAFYHIPEMLDTVKIFDTQDLYGDQIGLQRAAKYFLGIDVQQSDKHDCLEDAQTTMRLFHKYLQMRRLTLEAFRAIKNDPYADLFDDDGPSGTVYDPYREPELKIPGPRIESSTAPESTVPVESSASAPRPTTARPTRNKVAIPRALEKRRQ